MRNLLLKGVAAGAILAALASAPAQAADLPEAPVYIPPPIVYTWTGFYVGVHGGAGWVNHDNDDDDDEDDDFIDYDGDDYDDAIRQWVDVNGDDDDDDEASWLFGAQAGYNWQTGNFVFGIEADIAWTNFDRKNHRDYAWDEFALDVGGDNLSEGDLIASGEGERTFKVESDWLATIRARAGLAYERWLIYVTGGAAVTSVDVSFRDRGSYTVEDAGNHDLVDDSWNDSWDDDTTLWGWTVGVGVEGMITPNLTAKLEYLYINFNEDDFDFDTVDFATNGGNDVDIDAHVVRAGLNYKFNW